MPATWTWCNDTRQVNRERPRLALARHRGPNGEVYFMKRVFRITLGIPKPISVPHQCHDYRVGSTVLGSKYTLNTPQPHISSSSSLSFEAFFFPAVSSRSIPILSPRPLIATACRPVSELSKNSRRRSLPTSSACALAAFAMRAMGPHKLRV